MTPSVVVVGAGVAGLTAAHDLRSAGCDVVVVEARDTRAGVTKVRSSALHPVSPEH